MRPGDPRRDRAFSIFYVGINVGAFLAPLVCGTLGENARLALRLCRGRRRHADRARRSISTRSPLLPPDELQKAKCRRSVDESRSIATNGARSSRCSSCSCPIRLFWATYEQQGNTIALWADANTDRTIDLLVLDAEIPTTWFQAFNPFMIFAFTPFVVALWARQAARGTEPSTVTKMALGCFGVAARQSRHGAGGLARRRRQGELALAVRLFRRHHHRRALSLAGRAIARHQGRSRRASCR